MIITENIDCLCSKSCVVKRIRGQTPKLEGYSSNLSEYSTLILFNKKKIRGWGGKFVCHSF